VQTTSVVPYLALHVRTALWVAAGVVLVVLAAWALARFVPALRRPAVDRVVMPLSVLLYGAGYLAWGEKCSHQGGFGWDGIRFGAWAKDFAKPIFVDKLNHYYLQKTLPSIVVHYGLRAFGAEMSDKNVIFAFGVLDVACWTLVALAWVHVVRRLAIERAASWLGFVVIFVSFSGLKHYFWNPVLVDSFGMMLAAGMLVAYVRRWPWLIVILGFLGGFTIPGLLPMLAGLLAVTCNHDAPVRERRGVGMVLGVAGASVVVWAALATLDAGQIVTNGGEQPLAGAVPLSALALGVYLVALCAPLASFWPSAAGVWAGLRLRWLPAVALMLWGIHAIVERLKSTMVDVTPDLHFHVVLLLGIAKPFVSLVAHTTFIGPVLLLCIIMRRPLARAAWRLGPGMVLALCMGFVLSVDSESRHVIFFLPFWATALARAYQAERGRAAAVVVVAVIAIFLSRAWVPLETPPLGVYFERLFMSIGPWMTLANWGLHGAATLAAARVLWGFMPRRSC